MIAIILVNWNGADDTIECLESLLRLDRDDFRIIVCDNGSSEDLGARLRSWLKDRDAPLPDNAVWRQLPTRRRHEPTLREILATDAWDSDYLISLVQIGWNSGFAHANNVGIGLALAEPAVDFLWLLNNDTVVSPQSLTKLVERIEEDAGVGIVGSTLLYYQAPAMVQGFGGYFNPLTTRSGQIGHLADRSRVPPRAAVEQDLAYVIGASMLVGREFVASVGKMEEKYFLYYEEVDWANRGRPDYCLAWAPGSIVFHKEGASLGTNSAGRPSDLSIFFVNRGIILLYAKFYPLLIPVALLKTVYNFSRYLLRGDFRGCRQVVWGVRSAIFGSRNGLPESDRARLALL